MADDNQKTLKRCYNIEDYYENQLMPKLVSFPVQYLNRIKMIEHQKHSANKKIAAQQSKQKEKPKPDSGDDS